MMCNAGHSFIAVLFAHRATKDGYAIERACEPCSDIEHVDEQFAQGILPPSPMRRRG